MIMTNQSLDTVLTCHIWSPYETFLHRTLQHSFTTTLTQEEAVLSNYISLQCNYYFIKHTNHWIYDHLIAIYVITVQTFLCWV